jgi:hypothetical protein
MQDIVAVTNPSNPSDRLARQDIVASKILLERHEIVQRLQWMMSVRLPRQACKKL